MNSNMKKTVEIDKDAYEFLIAMCVGSYKDPYQAAGNRAYRDFNRTIRFFDLDENDRYTLRNNVIELLRRRINSLSVSNQEGFDSWHKDVCDEIIAIYKNKGIEFTYGQAQKWINMTIKYLFVIGEKSFDNEFSYLHVPIDNYILDIARDELGICKPSIVWSRWNDYEMYLDYQKQLRNNIVDEKLLRWEFKSWVKIAAEK